MGSWVKGETVCDNPKKMCIFKQIQCSHVCKQILSKFASLYTILSLYRVKNKTSILNIIEIITGIPINMNIWIGTQTRGQLFETNDFVS